MPRDKIPVMHLTVVCPACQSQYQVDLNLRGKKMRCPNAICRTVFEIVDPASPQPPPPIVEKPAAPPTMTETPALVASPPPKKPSWNAPPPVRASQPTVVAPLTEVADDFPDDDPPPDAASPPVATAPPEPKVAAAPPKRRRPLVVVAVLFVLLAIVGAVVLKRLAGDRAKREADLAAAALALYQASSFAEAQQRLQQFYVEYPNSPEATRFKTLATLSGLRSEVDQSRDGTALAETTDHVFDFLRSYESDPILKNHRGDLWETLAPLAHRQLAWAEQVQESPAVERASVVWTRAKDFAVGNIAETDAQFQKRMTAVRESIAAREQRVRLLDELRDAKAAPRAEVVFGLAKLVKRPEFQTDPEIAAAFKELRSAFIASIAFRPPDPAITETINDPFDVIPLVAPDRSAAGQHGGPPVLGLAPSGILYALYPKTGELAWAQRLGIDSRFAPILVSGAGQPPRYLIVSNDRKVVSTIDADTGKAVWSTPLSAPAACEPIVVSGHLLLALTSHRLDDLDPATGERRGFYTFDQPLPHGGVMLPGTSLVAVPGAATCVYIVDLAKRVCVDVLETGHMAGSLVGPPLAVAEPGGHEILLTQRTPGPAIQFEAIPYPPRKKSVTEFVVRGPLGRTPWHDRGAFVFATDDGRLHQIGRRLPGNPGDPLFFPLTPTEIALDTPKSASGAFTVAYAVAHADAENIWVVEAGRLQRVVRSFSPQNGPGLKVRWGKTPWIGDLVHAPVVQHDGDRTVLFLTTNDSQGSACWTSAIDGETGKILWRTRLGSTPRVTLDLGETLVWDDGGRLRIARLRDVGDKGALAIRSISIPSTVLSTILRRGDNDAVLLGWSPETSAIAILDVDFANPGEPTTIKLPAPLAGTPAVNGTAIFLPLKNGALARLERGTTSAITGPDWRSASADAESPAHLVVLRPGVLVATDGVGGLVAFEWSTTWKESARHRPTDRPLQGDLLVGPGPWLFAKTSDSIRSFDTDRLLAGKTWPLAGRPTAGPFVVGSDVMVVVDGVRLVCVDPAKDAIRWEAIFPAEILGPPRLDKGRLIVADLNGNFWTLDPTNGKRSSPDGRPALSVRAHLAPAVAPSLLPDGRLFVLWSDGSAGILSLP